MIHPHTQLAFISENIGWGVVATRPIPRGTITWVRDPLDQVLTLEEASRIAPVCREALDKYSFMDGRGDLVLCWDHARFVNHSCEAACLSPGFNFEIAIRDIQPGEELTDDYALLNISTPFQCLCGTAKCRGNVCPDDPDRLAPVWDAQIQRTFPLLEAVEQPLWALVGEKEKRQIRRHLADQSPPPSCLYHYRDPNKEPRLRLMPIATQPAPARRAIRQAGR